MKSRGHSTLGGRKVWFDWDVKRLNYDDHGSYLGEFNDDDRILVVLANGDFYCTNFDLNNHYEDNVIVLEKFDSAKVWSAALFDFDQGYPYLKRFLFEPLSKKQNYLGENPQNRLYVLTSQVYPRMKVTFGGPDSVREPLEIDVEGFIGVKGFKAKGKRITTFTVDKIEELEPLRFPDPPEETEEGGQEDTDEEQENLDPDQGKSESQIIDEITGQLNLFSDDDL